MLQDYKELIKALCRCLLHIEGCRSPPGFGGAVLFCTVLGGSFCRATWWRAACTCLIAPWNRAAWKTSSTQVSFEVSLCAFPQNPNKSVTAISLVDLTLHIQVNIWFFAFKSALPIYCEWMLQNGCLNVVIRSGLSKADSDTHRDM